MNDIIPVFRVALIGPESTGKSTLCEGLAEHFQTSYVPEFARSYVAGLSRKYNEEDVIHTIHEQIKSEDLHLKKASRIFFSDTESIMAKVWLEDVYGKTPDWMEGLITQNQFDLYLLTRCDLPFIDDPVRENPNRRAFFFSCYERELQSRKLNFKIVEGSGAARLQNAISIVEKEFASFSGRRTV